MSQLEERFSILLKSIGLSEQKDYARNLPIDLTSGFSVDFALLNCEHPASLNWQYRPVGIDLFGYVWHVSKEQIRRDIRKAVYLGPWNHSQELYWNYYVIWDHEFEDFKQCLFTVRDCIDEFLVPPFIPTGHECLFACLEWWHRNCSGRLPRGRKMPDPTFSERVHTDFSSKVGLQEHERRKGDTTPSRLELRKWCRRLEDPSYRRILNRFLGSETESTMIESLLEYYLFLEWWAPPIVDVRSDFSRWFEPWTKFLMRESESAFLECLKLERIDPEQVMTFKRYLSAEVAAKLRKAGFRNARLWPKNDSA